ncbi:MMPL family transporter [Brooklawnia cerclae]|uniref:RND superfamily putative drug exporter n=1 Tax=Brooklawnia cerclae TaxID=349934 RepID=A0ABX0SKM1_9ACTN|nr:MMPL family transporter [Brooklawnia cerclae]NIH58525.1 RND superfamily putative drug exporter [Brooklawnia cerclae]
MAELLYRLGKGCSRRPWIVISSWVVVVALAGVGFLLGFRTLTNSFDIPGLPSSVVVEDLQQELPDLAGASGTVVFRTDDGTPLTDEQRSEISARVASAQDLPDVAQVVDPFAAEDEREQQAQAIEAGRQQIEQGRAQLDASQQQLDAGRQQLDAGRAQLAAALEQAQAAGAPQETVAGLQAQLSQLDQQGAALDAGQAEIDAGLTQLETQAGTLENGAQLLAHADPIRVVSEDGSTAVVNVAFDLPRLELPDESKQAVIDHFTGEPVDGVEIGISTEIAQGVPKIIGGGEVTGVVVALIVLLVMLRSVVGALIPLATALTGVAIGVLGSLAFSGIVPMAVVTPVLGIMLGLAVGIDYSLFIINRHRTQLVEGAELHESIGLANGTSGNAVVFAGSTVAIALLALNVTRIPFLGVMGNVGAVAVVAAVLIAITLTPALLGLAGKRVLGRRLRAVAEQAPGSVGAHIAPARVLTWRRAIITVMAAVIGLLVVASPALSMRVGLPDGSSEPVGSLSQRAYVITEEEFGAGANGPLLVTAQFPEALEGDALVRAELDVADAITAIDGVVAAAPAAVAADGTMVAFQVIPDGGPNSETTAAVVRDLRGLAPVDGSITLGVAGQAATNIDISERLADILPVYLPIVVGLSLLIMIVVFRSLFVPIVATGGFLLSLFATYGVVVAVFQWGWGASLIGIHSTGPILNFLPVILVGVLFGLAMDYQLFLATGMREAYVHGADARHAVAEGFRAGRAVVIAAGLIMVSVFGGFVFADSPMIRSFGLGLAAGILFDAFVVRMLLMPALMHIAGAGAWWLPRWLDRIIPNVDVEGAALERRHKRTSQAVSPQ